MTKFLRVTMPDGSKWDVPAELIARNRANYYVRDEKLPCWLLEYEGAMGDNTELIDWAADNMDWDDVQAHAVKVPEEPAKVDYQDGWVNGDKEVLEHDHYRI